MAIDQAAGQAAAQISEIRKEMRELEKQGMSTGDALFVSLAKKSGLFQLLGELTGANKEMEKLAESARMLAQLQAVTDSKRQREQGYKLADSDFAAEMQARAEMAKLSGVPLANRQKELELQKSLSAVEAERQARIQAATADWEKQKAALQARYGDPKAGSQEAKDKQALWATGHKGFMDATDAANAMATQRSSQLTALAPLEQAAEARRKFEDIAKDLGKDIAVLRGGDKDVFKAQLAESGLNEKQIASIMQLAEEKKKLTDQIEAQKKAQEDANKVAEEAKRKQEQQAESLKSLIQRVDDENFALALGADAAREMQLVREATANGANPQEIQFLKDSIRYQKEYRDKQQTIEDGKKVWEQTRTPLEQYNAELERLKKLLESKAITDDTFDRAWEQAQDKLDKANAKEELKLPELQAVERRFAFTIPADARIKDTATTQREQLAEQKKQRQAQEETNRKLGNTTIAVVRIKP
jgi:hypothetical protein